MANGTRTTIEQQLKLHETRFEDMDAHQQLVEAEMKSLRDSVDGVQNQVNLVDKRLQAILESQERIEKMHLFTQKSGSPGKSLEPQNGLFPLPSTDRLIPHHQEQGMLNNSTGGGSYKTPRIDFPLFDGSQVRVWIQKANRFFQLNIMSDHQKILLASLYMRGRAENWYQTDALLFEKLSWLEFTERVKFRFYDDACENIVGEFNRLTQTSTLQKYLEKFEELYPLMLLKNKGLTESFFVDSFVSGLKEEIRHTVLMFRPTTLNHAISLARLQEATMESMDKPKRGNYTPFRSSSSYSTPLVSRSSTYTNTSSPGVVKTTEHVVSEIPVYKNAGIPPIKRLTPSEMQARREKGLCFNCDEVYVLGHKCKSKQLCLMIDDEEEVTTPVISGSEALTTLEEVAISLQALSGSNSFQTLQLQGKVKKQTITMLIDSGSTHNFLDAATAKQLGCVGRVTHPHLVSVAGGGKLQCDSMCPDFQWEIQGMQFSSDVRILPLGGCDLVLGVQWLQSIGPVVMDFRKLQMSFSYQGRQLVLQGRQTEKKYSVYVHVGNY
ncbi:hypothetical protein ACHQM5_020179 [Ranunculus cassubicifolius]